MRPTVCIAGDGAERPHAPLPFPLLRRPRSARARERAPERDAADKAAKPHPRPTNGIPVAVTVMNSTFASRGRLAM